jgi:hypothetical protein
LRPPQLIVLTANRFVLIPSTQATVALCAQPEDGRNAAALKCFIFYGGARPPKPLGPPLPGTLPTPPGCLFRAAARRRRRKCCTATAVPQGAAHCAVRCAEEPRPGSPSQTSCSAMRQVLMMGVPSAPSRDGSRPMKPHLPTHALASGGSDGESEQGHLIMADLSYRLTVATCTRVEALEELDAPPVASRAG